MNPKYPISKDQRLANIIRRAVYFNFQLHLYLHTDVDSMIEEAINHLKQWGPGPDAYDIQLDFLEDGSQHFCFEDGYGFKVEEKGLFIDFKNCKVGESVSYYTFADSKGHIVSLYHKVKRADKAR